jgi:hypothetical protein
MLVQLQEGVGAWWHAALCSQRAAPERSCQMSRGRTLSTDSASSFSRLKGIATRGGPVKLSARAMTVRGPAAVPTPKMPLHPVWMTGEQRHITRHLQWGIYCTSIQMLANETAPVPP